MNNKFPCSTFIYAGLSKLDFKEKMYDSSIDSQVKYSILTITNMLNYRADCHIVRQAKKNVSQISR